ncbi:cell wall-associated NlpC family hydrolase [Deinococcus metalli]|uniref:Cell wall-associated NlpC family hydrolase n=1 Tax=Deinococcus metalli TaxID=1141878 RepID=A0A7W8KBZ7_9DEIO|nr:SH3 domain-containing C40 family peptidase [Deinococcus metalli]MBB5375296.1 cell wall-associated NlpC family hydrolase [Deinococcus metalli]GHF30294.1 peptidase [Deinococcus metalli]
MSTELDPRIHAFDAATRTADIALRGRVGDDWTFVTPHAAQAGNARVSLRAAPDADSAQVTEALPGEPVEVLWEGPAGWQRVRTVHDCYLGWARTEHLTARTSPDLVVSALRAHAYAGPKVSRPLRAELCRGSRVTRADGNAVQDGHRAWLPVHLPDGAEAWVQEVVVEPMGTTDPAELALRFVDTPYVWGGRSAWGLDCSGLSQLVYAAAGRTLPRDADQQQAALPSVEEPRRGDLAFFPGHVGVMLDANRVVHANATHMRVTVETLGDGDYGRRLAADLSGFGRWPA